MNRHRLRTALTACLIAAILIAAYAIPQWLGTAAGLSSAPF